MERSSQYIGGKSESNAWIVEENVQILDPKHIFIVIQIIDQTSVGIR
jgi:hypothetical protein